MEKIKLFVQDKELFNEVKTRLLDSLDKTVLNHAYTGKDTTGSDFAKDSILKAFSEIQREFQAKTEDSFKEENI